MEWEDLLGYIRTIDNFEQSPLDGVLTQTEVIGDPALPKTRRVRGPALGERCI